MTVTALVLAWHDGPRHDGGLGFPLVPLLLVGLWITVFFTVGRRWRRGDGYHPSATSVLAERYARGEIDEAEYRQRRSVLRAMG